MAEVTAQGIVARGLVKSWPSRRPGSVPEKVLDQLDIHIPAGKTYGLVGESGSGKSTLALALLRLTRIEAGEIHVHGQAIHDLDAARLRLQRRNMQIIFQNPAAALDPRQRIRSAVTEPLTLYARQSPIQTRQQLDYLFERVGLDPRLGKRFPHQLSGGQLQRAMIARALVNRPQFLIADEPVSALDPPIQAQILNLLRDLQAELGFTMLFISHDLAVVQFIADRIGVIYRGQLLEEADNRQFFSNPCHPCSEVLLAASGSRPPLPASGTAIATPPDKNLCPYLEVCPRPLPACQKKPPRQTQIGKKPPHWVKCLHYG